MGRLPATMYETLSVADRLRRSGCPAAALTAGSGSLKHGSPPRPGALAAEQVPQVLSASSPPGRPGGGP